MLVMILSTIAGASLRLISSVLVMLNIEGDEIFLQVPEQDTPRPSRIIKYVLFETIIGQRFKIIGYDKKVIGE